MNEPDVLGQLLALHQLQGAITTLRIIEPWLNDQGMEGLHMLEADWLSRK